MTTTVTGEEEEEASEIPVPLPLFLSALPPTQIMIWPIIQVFLAAVQSLRIAAGCSAVRSARAATPIYHRPDVKSDRCEEVPSPSTPLRLGLGTHLCMEEFHLFHESTQSAISY